MQQAYMQQAYMQQPHIQQAHIQQAHMQQAHMERSDTLESAHASQLHVHVHSSSFFQGWVRTYIATNSLRELLHDHPLCPKAPSQKQADKQHFWCLGKLHARSSLQDDQTASGAPRIFARLSSNLRLISGVRLSPVMLRAVMLCSVMLRSVMLHSVMLCSVI